MESVCLVDSDDREEGEIVDDEFEDISDNSIIVPLYSGKCVSKEQLYALSLSSVSDLENERRHALRRRRRRRHRRHSSRNSTNTTTSSSSCISARKRKAANRCSISESDSDYDNSSLQKRLKEAVRIEETDDSQRNSLRARLEAMTKVDDNNLKSNENSTNEQIELDNELNLLRMEALRTAVMNKFVYRKKRKAKTDQLSDNSQKSDTNKENTNNEMNKVRSDEELKDKQDEEMGDEDEDVLRALLLASMSKKITKENDEIITETLPLDNSTKNDRMLIVKQQVQLPKVKPLIISINSDSSSESDDDNLIASENKIMDQMHFDLQNTVDKFLKEQRAKVEKEKLLTSTPVMEKAPSILEKSAVKLLPKFKQIEYQKLLQKIKNAEGNKRVRRSSKVNDIKLNKLKLNNNKIQLTNKLEKSQQEQKTETVALNKTLKDIHVNKNGRLQIQETYKILTPIVKKVNAANVERKKYNQRVKQLLEELTEAKKQLIKAHQNFTTSVKELLEKKALIDEKNKIKQKSTAPTKEPESNETLIVNDIKTDFVKQKQLVISGDPNDIDEIYNIKHPNLEFPKYVSPLDNKNRLDNDDPLAILCPFDMSGMCRDPECKYKHIAEQ